MEKGKNKKKKKPSNAPGSKWHLGRVGLFSKPKNKTGGYEGKKEKGGGSLQGQAWGTEKKIRGFPSR